WDQKTSEVKILCNCHRLFGSDLLGEIAFHYRSFGGLNRCFAFGLSRLLLALRLRLFLFRGRALVVRADMESAGFQILFHQVCTATLGILLCHWLVSRSV